MSSLDPMAASKSRRLLKTELVGMNIWTDEVFLFGRKRLPHFEQKDMQELQKQAPESPQP